MNYLAPDLVLNDIENFASSIKANYNVINCQVYDAVENSSRFIGFVIEKDGKQFIVKMEYSENEAGELAIKTKHWSIVEADGEVVATGLASLGEVFNHLDIKKV